MPKTSLASAALLVMLLAGTARAEAPPTDDPVRAFIKGEYPLGDDYFIHGSADTIVFRCLLTRERDGIDGLALSEISLWGNRSGPWEIFRAEAAGGFVYIDTRPLADTGCLESCRTREFLASGRCAWRRGWPQ